MKTFPKSLFANTPKCRIGQQSQNTDRNSTQNDENHPNCNLKYVQGEWVFSIGDFQQIRFHHRSEAMRFLNRFEQLHQQSHEPSQEGVVLI
jgi:hypothetical protein